MATPMAGTARMVAMATVVTAMVVTARVVMAMADKVMQATGMATPVTATMRTTDTMETAITRSTVRAQSPSGR